MEIVTALGALDLGVCRRDVAKLCRLRRSGSADLDGYLREALAGRGPARQQRRRDPGRGAVRLRAHRPPARPHPAQPRRRHRPEPARRGGAQSRQRPGQARVPCCAATRARLLDGTITVDEENNVITANGVAIQFIYAKLPEEIDYTAYGIHDALVVGQRRRVARRGGPLQAPADPEGVGKVLLTAPGKGEMKNIVCGVTDQDIDPEDTVISAASCTTNAITPVIKVLNDE
ncbi:hypothetical protein QJS66_10615 [Kocuria rhizophila]|nr:hypothetical protein QJS66_10615 [Kocuria rhizophila]